jgi:hypothetical protein
MTSSYVRCLVVSNNYLFAGNDDGSIWARPLSDFSTTGVHSTDEQIIPQNYTLLQNYPNPFNPVTNISFSLPLRSYTSLKVFDVIGREVTVIVSEELSAGSYTRQWNAAQMPSGVYFYKLHAGSYTETKKLILLK